jgi:hypothetical protein
MFRKQKIIVGMVIAAVLLAIFVLIFMNLSSRQLPIQSGQNQNQPPDVSKNLTEIQAPAAQISNFQKINSSPATAEAVARSFAERFGSFSNQSDFENIIDLHPFMTAKMRVWADDYVEKTRGTTQAAAVYYGITTRALGSEILKQDAASAVIQVNTSRREIGGNLGETKEYLQNIELTLVKEAGDFWKVDKAEWQKQ